MIRLIATWEMDSCAACEPSTAQGCQVVLRASYQQIRLFRDHIRDLERLHLAAGKTAMGASLELKLDDLPVHWVSGDIEPDDLLGADGDGMILPYPVTTRGELADVWFEIRSDGMVVVRQATGHATIDLLSLLDYLSMMREVGVI